MSTAKTTPSVPASGKTPLAPHVLVERFQLFPSTLSGEIRAFSICRNERLRIPAFLDHYRTLGVSRFFIVDNDSSDGTREYLAAQRDVHLFTTANRFGETNSGAEWMNAMLDEFGTGSWCLTVDVDELIAYPGSEDVPLRVLTAYLDRHGYEALVCMLVDLYPGGALEDCAYKSGDDLLAAAPYFDRGPYRRSATELCPEVLIRGGARERIFYPEFESRGLVAKAFDTLLYRIALRAPILRGAKWLHAWRRPSPPCLTKVPLVRWDRQSRYLSSTHWIAPKRVAAETGVLLHFKFLQDFHDRAVQEAARGEHYDDASEYRRYVKTLAARDALTLMYEGSTRFAHSSQLVDLGLMRDTQDWAHARRGALE